VTKQWISSGSAFEDNIGYSRAVVDGDYVYVSGTTGYDYDAMTISPDPMVQAEQCFQKIATALQAAGSSADDIVRVRYIFPNKLDFEPFWPVFKKYLAIAKPAATMIVAGLLDDAMKLEVEVTARLWEIDSD
jgi:enamine deaminase RidA (YjgF/YER057c/UK114 family)